MRQKWSSTNRKLRAAVARKARWPVNPEDFESLVAHISEGTSDRDAGPKSGISDLDLALPVGTPRPKRARLNPSLRVPKIRHI